MGPTTAGEGSQVSGRTLSVQEAAGIVTPRSYNLAQAAASNGGGESLPPIIVTIRNVGHNDHSSGEFSQYAPSDEGYDICVCHGQFEVAYEGLWVFAVDPGHPEIQRAVKNGWTIVIEQEVETRWELTLKKTKGKSVERYYTGEWIPVKGDGSTLPDPHWGGADYGEFCGMIVTESIRAKASAMAPGPKTVEVFPPVFKFESVGRGPESPPGGFVQTLFDAETPWATASASYTPFHCIDRFFTPGTNVGPRTPRTGGGTPTPPDSGSGGGTPTPRGRSKEDPGEIRHPLGSEGDRIPGSDLRGPLSGGGNGGEGPSTDRTAYRRWMRPHK